jgi:hypothetical protein
MLKIFISKAKELDIHELAVLAALNGMYSNKHEHLSTSIKLIGYEMTGKFLKSSNKKERTIIEGIRQGLKSLVDRKLITILEHNEDNYIISNAGLEVDTENEKFIIVELWEMQKIFSESNKPFNVFTFFANLIGTINNTTKEWHMSQDDMAAQWNCSKRTVNDYLEQLSDMKIIYLYKPKKRRPDGTFHKINNSYGRYCDASLVISAAEEYIKDVECEDICEKIDRRSIKLRYNAYCNGAKKYKDNPDAVRKLLKECRLYNKSLEYNPIMGNADNDYKQCEALDLSVFSDGNVVPQNKDIWGEYLFDTEVLE